MSKQDSLKKKTVSGIMWKGLERSCAQIVSMVVSIVLARILIPDDYSVVSIVTIFFTFCNLFITEGINSSLIQKKDADDLDFSTVLVLNICSATVLYVIMFFASPYIAKIYHKEIISPVIKVMALTFFINGYKAVLSAKIASEMKFKKYFFATIGGTVISAFVGVFMAIKGRGAWALVAQHMTNYFVDSVILTFTTKIRFKFKFSIERFKNLFSYGGKIFFASIITTIYNEVKPLIVGTKFSTTDLAFYNRGESFPSIINGLISSTLTSTLFPAMAKLQDDKEALCNITHRYIRVMSYIIFPALLCFFAVSDNFIKIVLTEKWLFASPYVKIFCIVYLLELIQIANINAIKAIGRSDLILKMELIKKVSYAVVIIVFVVFSKSPIFLALSGIVCNIIATIVNVYPNRKLIGYGYLDLIKDLFPNAIIAVPMCIIVNLMNKLTINMYLLLILQMLTGMILYLLFSIMTRNENLKYVINTVFQLVKKSKGDKNEA